MNGHLDGSGLTAGLGDPVLDSQSVFRTILRAMSYPGRRQAVDLKVAAPAPLGHAAAAVCLTLMDAETQVWLDPEANTGAVRDYLRFHCGCPLSAEPVAARFAVIAAPHAMPRLAAFDPGDDQYPDRSATLLVQVPSLDEGRSVRATGPGIKRVTELAVAGLPDWFWDDWAANGLLFPTGVDVIFASGNALVGLPRSIRAEG